MTASSLREFIDEVQVRWSGFRQRNIKLFNFPPTILRWILFTIPVYFIGKYLDLWFDKFSQGQLQFSGQGLLNELTNLVPFTILLVLWLTGTVWRLHNTAKDKHEDRMHYALRWLYEDLGFRRKPDADIRCTIWTPTNSKVAPEKMRLLQLVDYVPIFGQIVGPANYYRRNSNRGRVRKVAIVSGNTVKPIGLVGKCVIETMQKMKPLIMFENLSDDIDFVNHMMTIWNFSRAEAKRLTGDRKAYMCLSLMNAGRTDLLGIIFLDAREPNTFTKEIGDKAQDHLPRIAELLIDN